MLNARARVCIYVFRVCMSRPIVVDLFSFLVQGRSICRYFSIILFAMQRFQVLKCFFAAGSVTLHCHMKKNTHSQRWIYLQWLKSFMLKWKVGKNITALKHWSIYMWWRWKKKPKRDLFNAKQIADYDNSWIIEICCFHRVFMWSAFLYIRFKIKTDLILANVLFFFTVFPLPMFLSLTHTQKLYFFVSVRNLRKKNS